MKRAFTLVEVMVATMVMGIVMTAVFTSFLALQRMFSTAMVEMELSLASRQLREKLLFRAAPVIDSVTYAGILSGTNATSVVEGGGTPNIQMSCAGVGASLGDLRSQEMRIMMLDNHLLNERMPDKDSHAEWLWPGRLSLADESIADVVGCDIDSIGVYRLYLNINLKANVENPDGTPIVRRERIAVPVFGRLQPFQDSSGRY